MNEGVHTLNEEVREEYHSCDEAFVAKTVYERQEGKFPSSILRLD